MAVTTIANMQVVPEKFSQYIIDRATDKNVLVNAGIATADPTIAQILNNTPAGGRFVEVPAYNPIDAEDEVFGEEEVGVSGITTKSSHATILFRQKAFGATDLSHVLSGSDPMGAVGQLLGDWWAQREQKIYMSILKGILDPASGALKSHVNDISAATGTGANLISNSSVLDTKQLLGDRYDSLSMIVMHSATYTYLQKQNLIERLPVINPAGDTVEIQTYLGYRILIDDTMPVRYYEKSASGVSGALKIVADTASPSDGEIKLSEVNAGGLTGVAAGDYVLPTHIYTTYMLGSGCFARQDGSPAGFVGVETDRDKLQATDYLINRRCMIVHPRGFSWNTSATLTETFGSGTRTLYYPNNNHLATPGNWSLATNEKKIAIAALCHKLS